jgi:hypothetical protein
MAAGMRALELTLRPELLNSLGARMAGSSVRCSTSRCAAAARSDDPGLARP